jgi:hypothetical protein
MLRRYLFLAIAIFSIFNFVACDKVEHQGTDPDRILPSIDWVAMNIGGNPWGLNYSPEKTYYTGNYPVSSSTATQGCQIATESMPGKISVLNDREYIIEVKCLDPQPNGILRVIGNYENPRYDCQNYDYFLDNENDNPNDDPGLDFTYGSIHEQTRFFHQDNSYTAYGDDFINYEFGYGFGDYATGFPYFIDDGTQSETNGIFDRVAGDNIWTSYSFRLSDLKSSYRNFKSPDEVQDLIVRSYYDQSKARMCNWRLVFYAEDTTHFGVQGILPDMWFEITD